MAKGKGSSESHKITFGRRKNGKASKRKGPKDKPMSKYRGQG
jgi:hypothetical protein